MDPNPNKFPILSFVLSRVNSTFARTHDLEQPDADADADADDDDRRRAADEERRRDAAILAQMPGLNDPALVAAMAEAVSQVSQTRAVLYALGDRPDHEAVDRARAGFAEADAALARQLEELAISPPLPAGAEAAEWRERQEELERGCRRRAESDKAAYKAVMQLEQMHDAYEKVLGEAEERLLRIYRAAGSGGGAGLGEGEASVGKGKEVMNEEVASILRDGESGKLIERVDLSGRQLTLLPEAFGRIRGLVSLNLSNNQLETLPDSIAGLEILEELLISSNLLTTLPDSIGLLLRLKYLDISSNKLTALPDSISNCRSLVEINASFNKLSYLPTNIGYELVNLQKLDIYLNKLRSLPTSIGEMKSLRILDAHFNELRGLPHSIGKSTNLEILNLSSNFNDLTELPDTLGDLISLRELDLSNNQIHALPITFGRLDNLTKLNLDQNPLIIPPADILNKGVEAVKDYMSRMRLDILLEEEQKSMQEANTISSPTGWLNRSTSWLNNFVSGVSNNVSGYLGGAGGKSFKDPYLDQQL